MPLKKLFKWQDGDWRSFRVYGLQVQMQNSKSNADSYGFPPTALLVETELVIHSDLYVPTGSLYCISFDLFFSPKNYYFLGPDLP